MARRRGAGGRRGPSRSGALGAAGVIVAAILATAGCGDRGPREPAVPTPESARLISEGAERVREGRLPEALAAYEKALASQPDLLRAGVRAADLARRTGRPEAAARHARRALELAPADPADVCALVRAIAPEDPARAGEALVPLLASDPERADVQLAAAETALARGDRSAAVSRLRHVLAADPDAAILLDAGRAFSRAGFHDDAVETVRKAIAAGDTSPDARYALGWVLERAERWNECAHEYSSLIEDHPDYLPAYRNLGALMARDGELPRAIRLWEQGLRYHPDDPGLRANIDEALDALGLAREEASG